MPPLLLKFNCHPIVNGLVATKGLLEVPDESHGGDWNIWYRFKLTMLTSTGQEITVSRDLLPKIVQISLDSKPGAAPIKVDGVEHIPPYAFQAVTGTKYTLAAAAEMLYEQNIGLFDYWHVYGGWPVGTASEMAEIIDTAEIELLIPDTDHGYDAVYVYERSAQRLYLPMISAQ